MSAFLYFVYFSFRNYLYFSSSINKKSLILHEKNMLAIRIFSRFHLEGIQGGKTMKKEMETTKDAAINHSKSTKVDKTTKVKRSSTQDSILEEKEIQASKLPQETDTACETIKDDDKNHSKATKDNEAKEVKRRGEYRTKAKAGNTDKVPPHLLVISNDKYQNAMSLNKNDTAYMQMVSDNSKLRFENGILTFKGFPATPAELQEIYTEEGIEKINIPLLMVIYSIIHEKFSETMPENQNINERINIYYPELAKGIGKSPKITKSDVQDCIHSIKLFEKLIGIITNGTGSTDILPVIYNAEYDTTKNVISFTSPYIVKLIREIYTASIRTNKKKQVQLKKNGQPQMVASHSYMIHMDIAKEKNKKAVEIVFIVVAVIEKAGKHNPNIKAETIIERSCLLKHSLHGQTAGNKTNTLKRAFRKAWELLREKTDLISAYEDIHLPDPEDISVIPTSATLDINFKFPNNGKPQN